MSARMESKSDNSSSMNTANNNNSNKGGRSDIEHYITNPREVQRNDHSDQPQDLAAPGKKVSTPTHDPEFLLSYDQFLETIAKSGISQSSCRTFQRTG